MSEYIVDGAEPNSTVLKSTTSNGYEHEKWLPVREKIVRCRDCKWFSYITEPPECYRVQGCMIVESDGFCAWGERANFATCKCGEDIEIGERESAVCPRCNRTVRA